MQQFRSIIRKIRRRLPTARDWLVFSLGVLLATMVIPTLTDVPLRYTAIPAQGKAEVLIAWLPPTVQRWNSLAQEYGRMYNIDPELLAIIMTVESGGNPHAKSEAGATGLMQIMPQTAGDIAKRYIKQPRTSYDLEDPRTSVEFGAAYLAMLRDEFGEARHAPDWNTTVEYVAAGYNGGGGTAGALYRGEGLRDTEPVIYSRDVYNMWRERRQPKSPTYERWLERGGQALVERAQEVH